MTVTFVRLTRVVFGQKRCLPGGLLTLPAVGLQQRLTQLIIAKTRNVRLHIAELDQISDHDSQYDQGL